MSATASSSTPPSGKAASDYNGSPDSASLR
jgi:hypothetical protein